MKDFDAPLRNKRGLTNPKYLSPEHMSQMKFIVREAAKRGMKLWIQDESDYPSGFAGGKVSEKFRS